MRDTLCDLLGAYVPADRLRAMAEGRALPEQAPGAMLFADISGFTPLAEALERTLGARRGCEELTGRLNEVYGALIGEVARYDGSVLGFSGDAITCWFASDDGARATACGLTLLDVVARRAGAAGPTGAPHALAIKVAVTSGVVRRFVVGDPRLHVLDAACGAAVDRVAIAEGLAHGGELLVGEEVVRALGPRATVTAWREGGGERFAVLGALAGVAPPPPRAAFDPAALSEAQLRPWLLPSVYQTLQSGQIDYLADLRQAVALFVRFDGLDLAGDAAVGAKLDAYVRFVQGVLVRYEGALIQLTIGDKGSYLYAAFGAPVAHEDVVERALAAALLLRTPPPALGIGVRIGLSAGRMRCGAYGSEARRTYGVLGDETNVAARLMARAQPGQILVSGHVARGAARWDLEALGELTLKGRRSALPVFALRGRRAPGHEHAALAGAAPLVGRVAERARAAEALAAARRGEPGALVIEGEPGIGKSQLVGDLIERAAEAPPVTCLVAAAEAIEQQTPLYAWRKVFAVLLGTVDATPAEVADRLAARLPEALRPLAPLLSPVLPTDLPDTAQTAQLRGATRTRQMVRVLAHAFAALVGPGPVLLVIEDVHWLDSLSWALVERLREDSRALLVAVTARVQPSAPEAYRRLVAAPGTTHLRLRALAADDVAALVCQRLGVAALPAAVERLIRDKAEGNPFFAVELAHALRDAGLLRVEGGVCEVAQPLDALAFPDTIEGVVTGRIDRLRPPEQLALKVASVLGRGFLARGLHDLFPVADERHRVPALLDALTRLELTAEEAPEPDARYAFRHAITREVAYNLMLFQQRRALHEAAAEWYERTYAGDLGPYHALLAHHRVRAIEAVAQPDEALVDKALAALLQAGRQALGAGAAVEAASHLEVAHTLIDKLPPSRRRASLELDLCTLGGAALAVVRGPTHDEVRRLFARASELCLELGETARLFEAIFGIWYAHLTGSERAGALEFSARLLEVAGRADDPMMRVVADHARGATAICDGNHEEGLRHMDAVLATLRLVEGSAGALAQARNTEVMTHCYRAWGHWFLGWPDAALADSSRAGELAERVGHPLTLMQALCFRALVRRYRGEVDEAVPLVADAARLAAEHAFPYWSGVASAIQGWIDLERGDLDAGVARLLDGRARDRRAGVFSLTTVIVLCDLLDALARLERFDEAEAIAVEARALHEGRLIGFGVPELMRLEGELWRRRGVPSRAAACFDEALARARAGRARSLELRVLLSRARGGSPAAVEALAALLAWFTEGHDTRDLREARALVGDAPPPHPQGARP